MKKNRFNYIVCIENSYNMNTTDYPLHIKKEIEDIASSYANKEFLRKFQYIIKEYLVKSSIRGLLLYHSPGQGKTISAAAIADYYRKYDPNRRIVVLLSKSLQTNFESNIRKFMKKNPDNSEYEKSGEFIQKILDSRYKFISLNASNMYTQISKIKRKDQEMILEKHIGNFNEHVSRGFLENTLLIIDEFHNLSNSITNGSNNAVKLYNTIMNTKNIKLLFLTGTPIVNNPFELVPTYNLLKGYIYYGKTKHTLFPENRQDFDIFFVRNGKIKNKEKFQNRIFGMVSYYGDYYFDKKGKQDFPEQKKLVIETIPMSLFQFGRYQEVREIERKEEVSKFKKSKNAEKFSDKTKDGSSSYRIRSRQISNFFIPEYALTFSKSRTSVVKHIKKIKREDLRNLNKFSPKFKKILENISLYPRQLGVVYSEFVSGEGLYLFADVLEGMGYIFWERSQNMQARTQINDYIDDTELVRAGAFREGAAIKNATYSDADSKINPPSRAAEAVSSGENTFAIITGDIPIMERQNIINMFNSKDNKNGNIISLLLISKSGAEGLSLKNVRHIHIMEPFWNYTRIEQVMARGIRYMSHVDLPPEERNVQPYIYLSTYPYSYDKKLIKERTTDEELWYTSLNGKILREDFELAVIETAIDCSINYDELEDSIKEKFKCRLCAPTGENLYNVDLHKDINSPDVCKPVSKSEIEAKEIKVSIGDAEETFYYTFTKNGANIYIYSPSLLAYVPVKKSYPFYGEIMRQILALN